jgi:hypothetical protein
VQISESRGSHSDEYEDDRFRKKEKSSFRMLINESETAIRYDTNFHIQEHISQTVCQCPSSDSNDIPLGRALSIGLRLNTPFVKGVGKLGLVFRMRPSRTN